MVITEKCLGRTQAAFVFALFVIMTAVAQADVAPITYRGPMLKVHLIDPHGAMANQAGFFADLQAAVAAWDQVLEFKAPLVIEVKMIKAGVGRMDGASVASHLLTHVARRDVWEEGAAYKIRTGHSADPSRADILIRISPEYLNNEVWIDPHPDKRINPIPPMKLDLVSLLEHEIAHGLGFHSFRDLKTAKLPDSYMSVMDLHMKKIGSRYYFVGKNAEEIYGGPVPMTSTVTSQNFQHYGDPGDPPDLLGGLMNGVCYHYRRRYVISPLDVAILQDMGLPVRKTAKLKLASAD